MFDKFLGMSPVLNTPRFWKDQVSEYASAFECVIVLDLYQSPEYSRVTHVAEYAWMIPEYAWICLIMSGYVWRCLNMPEYALICLNLPKLLLFYIFPFFNLFYKPYSTWARVFLFDRLQETRGYSLKQREAVFLKRQNFIFPIVAGSISFISCFRLNILRFQFCVTFQGRGVGCRKSWHILLVFCFFLVKALFHFHFDRKQV